MTKDPAGRCSLCNRLVLGLAGQDWCVLPWMLDGDDAGVRPGPCHVRCLDERGAARRWAEAVETWHCARWPLWRAGRDGGVRWRLHAGPRARRFHLWRSDGRLSSFPYAAVRVHPAVLTADLAEAGSAYGEILLAAMGAGAEAPLARVVARLGLTDRYPLGAGVVTHRLRNVGTARCAEMIDVLVARHPLALGEECRRAAHELMRRAV